MLRTRDGADAAALSGMAQSLGYLVAASGPFVVGLLHDATDGWTAPVILFIVVWVLIGVAGMFAGRPRIAAETVTTGVPGRVSGRSLRGVGPCRAT